MVLFDIDGTLVRRTGPYHGQALVEAVRRVTGLDSTTDHIPVHGMLDTDIIARMMRDAGAGAALVRRSMPDIIRRAQQVYVRSAPDLQGTCCPGVEALLDRLRRHRILMGLVTGNLTRIGWRKLERAGLKPYFRFGAFAEMAKDRAGLARQAIRHARERGWSGPGEPVSLIGDAPSDIIAAKANGIRSIAVYTGISSMDELAEHNPDYLLKDLRSLRLLMVR